MDAATNSPFSYIDVFAGIGGFAAALESFGGECVYSVEIDDAAEEQTRSSAGDAVTPAGSGAR